MIQAFDSFSFYFYCVIGTKFKDFRVFFKYTYSSCIANTKNFHVQLAELRVQKRTCHLIRNNEVGEVVTLQVTPTTIDYYSKI